jgi:hypothetical protein
MWMREFSMTAIEPQVCGGFQIEKLPGIGSHPFNPIFALGTGRSGERGVKMVRNVTRLQGGSGNPRT